MLKTLKCMQKGKFPSLERTMVKFYTIFYDLIEEDLLKFFRESQAFGKFMGYLHSTLIDIIPNL